MKSRILSYFTTSPEEYISGEKISKELNVSRAAVWKYMQTLKKEGYEFESQSRRGYRLKTLPDYVAAEIVDPFLKTQYMGREYYYVKSIDSTNQLAKKLASEGKPEGAVVVAEEQSTGKGRFQRGWYSPSYKGMWLSIILRPDFLPQEAPKMTLLFAVAIAKILNRRGIPAGIKWPNDILLNGKKIVGILTELSAEMERIHYVVVGVGLNINIAEKEMPKEIREIATSLLDFTGKKWNRAEIIADFLLEVEILYEVVKVKGFKEVFDAWRELNITLGREVKVIFGDKFCEGVALDIDPSGALLIKKHDGTKELVQAGDVSIRPILKQ